MHGSGPVKAIRPQRWNARFRAREGDLTSEVECTFQESNQVVVRTSEDL